MDAKYKKIRKPEGVDSEDLYRLITYMHVLKSSYGVLICTDNESEMLLGTLAGFGGCFYKYGFNVVNNGCIKSIKE